MSFEDPPHRPRSTPIPDGWGAPTETTGEGRSVPSGPSTGSRPQDSTPRPPDQIHLYAAAIPVKAITRMWIIRSVFALIVAGAGLGFGWYVYRDTQKKVDQVLTAVPTFTIPNVAGPTSAGPDPAASLYDSTALPQLIDQFEQIMPGEPTQFTQIVLYPTYAIASAQDPADPASTFGVLWRSGAVTAMPGFPVQEIDSHRFTVADVNWAAIDALVAQAPHLMDDPTGTVSHVIVLRSDFDAALPIRVLVYVDEAGGYVEADANAVVVATH